MEFNKENLQNLCQKRGKYINTALSIYAQNTDNHGDFKDSKAESDFMGLLFKINDTGKAIEKIANAVDPGNDIYKFTPVSGISSLEAAYEESRKPDVPPAYSNLGNYSAEVEGKGVCLTIESKKFANMFKGESRNRLSNGGFKNFNDFLNVVHSGRYDERLGLKNTMTESVPSTGGFSVPEEYAALLFDNSLESEIVRPRAQVWPMKSETRKIPAWDGANHSSGLYGGLLGVWLGEGATATRQDAKLRLMQLTANKLAIFSQASNELIADGMDFESQLGQAMINSMGWTMDFAFLQGDGVAKPLGVLSDPALITISKEAGQAAGTIVFENICEMFARLASQCVNNSVWVVNSTVIPQLLTMTVSVGTAGSVVEVMSKDNGQFTLLTRPVLFTEKVPALGSKGDIILVDFSQYAIGLRKEVSLDKSNAPGWTEDMTDYRTIIRVDGQGTWDKPIQPKNGDTLSWCVTLEAR